MERFHNSHNCFSRTDHLCDSRRANHILCGESQANSIQNHRCECRPMTMLCSLTACSTNFAHCTQSACSTHSAHSGHCARCAHSACAGGNNVDPETYDFMFYVGNGGCNYLTHISVGTDCVTTPCVQSIPEVAAAACRLTQTGAAHDCLHTLLHGCFRFVRGSSVQGGT